MLEPDAPRQMAPKAAEWIDALAERLREVAARDGTDAVGEGLITAVAGEHAWRSFPDQWQRVLTQNGPAILAELAGEWWLEADAAVLAAITQPTLLVAAAESPPEFHEPINVFAGALSHARTELVGGDHIINPAAPEVIAFAEEVLEGTQRAGIGHGFAPSFAYSGREP
jgi:hypothetical protein